MAFPDVSPFEDSSEAQEKEGWSGRLPEFVRKAAVVGLGALFMTEEGLRSVAGQLKLPKEVLSLLMSQAEKAKDDLGAAITEEIRRFLQSDKLKEELLRFLAGATLEIKAEVRLVPQDMDAPKAEALKTQVLVSEIKTHGKNRRRRS